MNQEGIQDKKILIIEDDVFTLEVLTERFRQEGFKVFEARCGYDGLNCAFKEHPDLILLDLVMPRMNGITMLKRLRADGWGGKVPVVVLTNLSRGEIRLDMLESGADCFLIKSEWKLDDVVSRVKGKLEIKTD